MNSLETRKQLLDIISQISKQLDTKQQIDDFIQTFKAVVEVFTRMKAANELQNKNLDTQSQKLSQDFTLAIADLQNKFEQFKASIRQPEDGKTPQKGVDYFDGLPGEPGRTPTTEEIIALIKPLLPVFEPATAELTRNELESLTGSDRLNISAINGIEQLQADIQGVERRLLGAMTPSGPILYVGGAKKGRAQELKLKAGSNVTISHNPVTGEVTFNATGGSGFTTLDATETPNGSIVAFTFATASAKPSYLVIDNVWVKPVSKAGTTNWTWSGTVATLSAYPAPNDDIFAVV